MSAEMNPTTGLYLDLFGPTVAFIIMTPRLAQFFQEVGRPVTETPQPVKAEDLARFAAVSTKYGYWNASPEQNAEIGIRFSLIEN